MKRILTALFVGLLLTTEPAIPINPGSRCGSSESTRNATATGCTYRIAQCTVQPTGQTGSRSATSRLGRLAMDIASSVSVPLSAVPPEISRLVLESLISKME
jgi:hypothetical protein